MGVAEVEGRLRSAPPPPPPPPETSLPKPPPSSSEGPMPPRTWKPPLPPTCLPEPSPHHPTPHPTTHTTHTHPPHPPTTPPPNPPLPRTSTPAPSLLPSPGPLSSGPPKISRLFFPPAAMFILSSLLGVFSWNCGSKPNTTRSARLSSLGPFCETPQSDNVSVSALRITISLTRAWRPCFCVEWEVRFVSTVCCRTVGKSRHRLRRNAAMHFRLLYTHQGSSAHLVGPARIGTPTSRCS